MGGQAELSSLPISYLNSIDHTLHYAFEASYAAGQ